MKILCDAGIVIGRKEGKWTYYSISEKGAKQAETCLRKLTALDAAKETSRAVNSKSLYRFSAVLVFGL